MNAVDQHAAFKATIPMDFARAKVLYAHREALLSLLNAENKLAERSRSPLILALVHRTRWQLQRLNQFMAPPDEDPSTLTILVQSWLDAMHDALSAATNVAECTEMLHRGNIAHVRNLSAVVTQSAQLQGRIRSEEYSVETQLRVLQLQPSTLIEPVVDVGCGRGAHLVKWLRGRNIRAIGIDLFASGLPGCLVTDWFEFPWLPEQFGTVVAHLSFSLHFLHQHLRPDGDAGRYAHQYMAILHSVRQGGRVVYAPGLPFIEKLLPSDKYNVKKYAIERLPIDDYVSKIFTQNLDENPIYACHVVRV